METRDPPPTGREAARLPGRPRPSSRSHGSYALWLTDLVYRESSRSSASVNLVSRSLTRSMPRGSINGAVRPLRQPCYGRADGVAPRGLRFLVCPGILLATSPLKIVGDRCSFPRLVSSRHLMAFPRPGFLAPADFPALALESCWSGRAAPRINLVEGACPPPRGAPPSRSKRLRSYGASYMIGPRPIASCDNPPTGPKPG